jgi:hypothetical protein
MKKNKLAVYTAIFGGYDTLMKGEKLGDCDYICFSDEEMETPPPWQLRVVERPHPDPSYASRYYFDQSTVALPDYEYTIMHGGNRILIVKPESLLKYLKTTDIAAYQHPMHRTLEREFNAIMRLEKAEEKIMRAQIERYRADGFPCGHVTACTILIRRNTPAVQKFEKMWWNEVKNGSRRDQISFDYVRWKLKMKVTHIPGNVFRSNLWKEHGHNLVHRYREDGVHTYQRHKKFGEGELISIDKY